MQASLFEEPGHEEARSLLTQLLDRSRLYRQSKDFKELLDFVSRLRNFAPFNAMLLNLQRPGLRFAASERDWVERFHRAVKEGARPLIILWPFGPIALVFDLDDTEGSDLPVDVAKAFRANGEMNEARMQFYFGLLRSKGIDANLIEYGDAHAGHIQVQVERRSVAAKKKPHYRVRVHKNHDPNVQFATLTHELGHLFLGHLGPDAYLKIPDRRGLTHDQVELEAESLAYLVCQRNGVTPLSESYLTNFVRDNKPIERLDIYSLMKVAGQVENILELNSNQTRFYI